MSTLQVLASHPISLFSSFDRFLSLLYPANSIILVIVYLMDSVYVQKPFFPVLLLLDPSMESQTVNFDVVVTTVKLLYGLFSIILPL